MRSIALPSWIERGLGLAARPVPPHVFAVGRRELRYGAFLAAPEGHRFQEFHSVPLPAEMFGNGPLGTPLADPAPFEAALERLQARISVPVKEASLVLPDSWARHLMVELGELPQEPKAWQEVLRFRLRRLLPFRVEELRLDVEPVASLLGPSEPGRSLVSFASEALCEALEAGFARRGIRIGQIVGATLATVAALARGGRTSALWGVTLVDAEGFALAIVSGSEPVLWRQKSFTPGLADADRARLLTAELRLTRTFLSERLAAENLGVVFLAAPREVEPFWLEVLAAGLDCRPLRLGAEHLPLAGEVNLETAAELAPLVGAACREVA